MKIRQGFVSNSSSSSFVVGIKPEVTVEDIKELLIKNKDIIIKQYDYDWVFGEDTNYDELDDCFLERVAKRLHSMCKSEMFGVNVGSFTYYSEDRVKEDFVIAAIQNMVSEKIKVIEGYN